MHTPSQDGSAELADVVVAACRHLGGRGIADMRVVCPDNGLRMFAIERHHSLQRLEHVRVAQVPGGTRP